MLTLYTPGSGWVHRAPTGPKTAVILGLVLTVSLLPSNLWTVAISATVACFSYTITGSGWREFGRQLTALRWLAAIAVLVQAVLMPLDIAMANVSRVLPVILIANVVVLTTWVTALLDLVERWLRPLRRVGVDSERIALVLAIGITTIPVLASLASEVRESQRAGADIVYGLRRPFSRPLPQARGRVGGGPHGSWYPMTPPVREKAIDSQTRCVHYHTDLDIVAIKFRCCGDYYPCHLCHEECAGHATKQRRLDEYHQNAIPCGACSHELTIAEYRATERCPNCAAGFNPRCALHAHFYFATN